MAMEWANVTGRLSVWSDTEQDALDGAVLVTSCLSVVGCVLIMLSYACFPDLRTTSRELLVYLSIADFVTAVGNALGSLTSSGRTSNTPLCVFQSVLTTSSSISSFLWTVSIALFLYMTIVMGNPALAERAVVWFHIFSWGIPAIVVAVAGGLGVLGYDGMSTTVGWCWIRGDTENILLWQLLAGKGWEVASYLAVPVLYLLIKRAIARDVEGKDAEETQRLLTKNAVEAARSADRKMTFIPAVFIAVRIWGTARFFFGTVLDKEALADMFWLAFLQGVGDSSQGFFNFVLFCVLTKKIRARYANMACGGQRELAEVSPKAKGGIDMQYA